MLLNRAARFTWLLPLAALPASCQDGGADASATGGHGGEPTLEGAPCSFGDAPAKCGSHDDLACAPTLTETGRTCGDDDECKQGELCFVDHEASGGATCQAITGSCTTLAPAAQGLAFGESCDPTQAKDPCAGACVPIGADGAGECEQTCRVGAESDCDQGAISGADVACAFFAYDLSAAGIEQGAGDLGICAHFCDCNAQCPGSQLCLSAPTAQYLGICAGGVAVEDSIEVCDGLGGAGGSAP